MPPDQPGYKSQYDHLWKHLAASGQAHARAVGGDFEIAGRLEFALLRSCGLTPESSVIDVGCGSGRLAAQLAPGLRGGYLGTDILPSLLEHARQLCGRPDWRFVETNGESIPAADESADFVCFFSVFTHLSHEQTWRYLLESKRVLRPGGKIVCSFLEFKIRSHWTVFEQTFANQDPRKVLSQFLSRDAFEAFAFNAALDLEAFHDGDKPHIPFAGEVVWESGLRMSGLGHLGQSVCVLRKPLIARPVP